MESNKSRLLAEAVNRANVIPSQIYLQQADNGDGAHAKHFYAILKLAYTDDLTKEKITSTYCYSSFNHLTFLRQKMSSHDIPLLPCDSDYVKLHQN